MITLIHGDNQAASRKSLVEKIEHARLNQHAEIVRVNGESLDLTSLKQAVESRSLLADGRLTVIENLFTRRASEEKKSLVEYIGSLDLSSQIVLWEKNLISVSLLKKLPPNARIELHKVSPVLFHFLDSLAPGNTKVMLQLAHQAMKSDDVQFLFHLTSRRIRDLIIAADLGVAGLFGKKDWQQSRLVRQSRKFSLSGLLAVHDRLYAIDKTVKTGRNILPLPSLLDLLVAEI